MMFSSRKRDMLPFWICCFDLPFWWFDLSGLNAEMDCEIDSRPDINHLWVNWNFILFTTLFSILSFDMPALLFTHNWGRIVGFIPLPGVIGQGEMQLTSSRIWNLVTVSILATTIVTPQVSLYHEENATQGEFLSGVQLVWMKNFPSPSP